MANLFTTPNPRLSQDSNKISLNEMSHNINNMADYSDEESKPSKSTRSKRPKTPPPITPTPQPQPKQASTYKPSTAEKANHKRDAEAADKGKLLRKIKAYYQLAVKRGLMNQKECDEFSIENHLTRYTLEEIKEIYIQATTRLHTNSGVQSIEPMYQGLVYAGETAAVAFGYKELTGVSNTLIYDPQVRKAVDPDLEELAIEYGIGTFQSPLFRLGMKIAQVVQGYRAYQMNPQRNEPNVRKEKSDMPEQTKAVNNSTFL